MLQTTTSTTSSHQHGHCNHHHHNHSTHPTTTATSATSAPVVDLASSEGEGEGEGGEVSPVHDEFSGSGSREFTLRIRCKDKVHKFPVRKVCWGSCMCIDG